MARFARAKKKMGKRFDDTSDRNLKRRKTEYGARLEEKQKIKYYYGLSERQLKRYAMQAQKSKANPPEKLLQALELRLDNVIARAGWAKTNRQSRQFVSHRKIAVNGRKISIPSYRIKTGDILSVDERFLSNIQAGESNKSSSGNVPAWMKRQKNIITVLRIPVKNELPPEFNPIAALGFYKRK